MGVIRVRESAPPQSHGQDTPLRLHVIHTTPEATRNALKTACSLAQGLRAEIRLLAAKTVPFPRPLEDPETPADFTEALLTGLVRECGLSVEIGVLLCRDCEETIPRWLPPESIAIIGRPRPWGPGSSRRLIHAIQRAGRRLIVVDAKKENRAYAYSGARRAGL
jgi:hypothetical protein